MIGRLFGQGKDRADKDYRTPDEQCAYVIGDVHGCLPALERLLRKIERRAVQDHPNLATKIIFLGDLIDRGEYSSDVLDMLIDYKPYRIEKLFLKGNHEEVFLSILDGDMGRLQDWFTFGGRETARSYGVENLGQIDFSPENIFKQLLEKVPKKHIKFLEGFKTHYEFGDYICVHAGLRPKVPLEEQTEQDMMWIRDDFLDYRGDFSHKIVHGHTIVETPENKSNRIAVDTGAYKKEGRLTAVFLSGTEVEFIDATNEISLEKSA